MKLKNFVFVLSAALLFGCASPSQFTRLTPLQQSRNPNNVYPVEVKFESTDQSMRHDTLKGFVEVNGQLYPLHPMPLVQNRWEGFVPVMPGSGEVEFRFKFTYLYNAFGSQPKSGSTVSPTYKLRVE